MQICISSEAIQMAVAFAIVVGMLLCGAWLTARSANWSSDTIVRLLSLTLLAIASIVGLSAWFA